MNGSNETEAPFEFIDHDQYTVIKLRGDLAPDSAPAFDRDLETAIAEGNIRDVVIHSAALKSLAPSWVRSLLGAGRKLKSVGRQLRVILLSESMLRKFKELGIDQALTCCPTLQEALVDFGVAKPKTLDVNFINPFLIATLSVLSVQAATQATPGKPQGKSAGQSYLGDISGVIGLVSTAFTGSVVISFPTETFLKIMSRMLGETYSAINKDLEDGASELINIVFGQAKVMLNEQGYGIRTALPSVVTGRAHTVQSSASGMNVVVPFDSDAGPFYIEISMSS